MSIHKLTAGSGYDYLTRQVAAQDATDKGHTGLAGYYTAKGEAPGTWVGSGMAGLEGLDAGDVVTAEQMQALFGSGHHPLAQQRRDRLEGPDLTSRDYQSVARLGAPYKVYSGDVSAFRLEVAKRIAEIAAGLHHPEAPIPMQDRAAIRTEVAVEFFRAEHGRDPEGAREVAATIAKHSRPRTTAVAGYDLTFSPVKSVSTLWAIADPATSARIERAHHAAVRDALAFLEQHALYTRTGTNGVRQVDVRGLVAAAFTHRDSRAGDPDLHTHVAVANKVQTEDGRWLSIDGRVLFKANVTASETYNTALEKHLQDDLGLRFEERPGTAARKRPVREVAGVDPRLNLRWSARRTSIEARRNILARDFQRTHGRPPTPIESIQLAQQATLEIREPKKEPRSLAEQRVAWRRQAAQALGGQRDVDQMIRSALQPARPDSNDRGAHVDAAWTSSTAAAVLSAVETRRSTWQVWHVRAEAQRQVRAADVRVRDVEALVDLLVGEVLDRRSVRLTHPDDGVSEPAQLRRKDSSSVYTVAGASQYTSTRVLQAEQRLVAAAGRHDGRAVPAQAVDLALLESTANGATLNAGQAGLVRGLATSGARLQLAIAPAGAGKTTALKALAAAWANGGGHVIGLAPSAAAATALREHLDGVTDTTSTITTTGATGSSTTSSRTVTDTLAKLTWSITRGELPDWAVAIGRDTLVVIDEAGMADTLSLDTAVAFITDRGGSVRLIGDDQQLAAIGAGGVLRDLAHTHGALALTELMRFTDPAEGAATLALRDGAPESLGFYLDHGRVHVGDLATITEDVFTAWRHDRAAGLDAVMLAPTRELVAELNHRARAHRLDGATPGPEVRLSDGNLASVGDLVITRSNDRRLRISATDWVKNGDRWTVLDIGGRRDHGGLTVRHAQNGRVLALPASYVQACTELGYATTVHSAQGISVDAMHGLATGGESRQQLYTMLTRGRTANHVYLEVVGDGDPHNAIRPDNIAAPTATDILHSVLARDDSPVSASTQLRDQDDPARLLGHAASRYTDALHFAAEEMLGVDATSRLEREAGQMVPGLLEQPAWPTLRSHLVLLGAHGLDPVLALHQSVDSRELATAGDSAAVLDWRLDDSGLRNAGPGPLPWLPGIPAALKSHPTWGQYLSRRAELVDTLAAQVRTRTGLADTPPWASQGTARPNAAVLGDVQVWRAATQVAEHDRRPTGPPQVRKAAALWARRLNSQLRGTRTPAMAEWADLLRRLAPAVRHDDFTPLLAERLAAMSRAGLDARGLLHQSLTGRPLPDDHAAAAMWWRISRHLTPAVAQAVDHCRALTTSWLRQLTQTVGHQRVAEMRASLWWPALVTSVDHALERGWALQDLLSPSTHHDATVDVDDCQSMVWRIYVLTDPPPDPDGPHEGPPPEDQLPPDDIIDGVTAPEEVATACQGQDWPNHNARQKPQPDPPAGAATDPALGLTDADPEADVDVDVEIRLLLAAMLREVMGPLEPADAQVETMVRRAADWDQRTVSRERMLTVNQMTLDYFRSQLRSGWAPGYLDERFGDALHEHPNFAPGYAPAGWTNLVDVLRGRGVSDEEMTVAGVATTASNGRTIDRFRDRVMLPITQHGQVLGFIGRRHPDLTDANQSGPKYLNTADTPLFHKGAQLFGADRALLRGGATPVIVEGPMDAIAVTIAGRGAYVGVAPLGASLSEEQAAQIASLRRQPIVATDGDHAGRIAAERDFWMLAQHGLDPLTLALPEGSDPADALARRGPHALVNLLDRAQPLGTLLIDERLRNLAGEAAMEQATKVLAARPATTWEAGAKHISDRLSLPHEAARDRLSSHVSAWNCDPRKVAQAQLTCVREVHDRIKAESKTEAHERWVGLAQELDPRLSAQADWPALAGILEHAHRQGLDVAVLCRQLVAQEPLRHRPAQDLRYRLVAELPDGHAPSAEEWHPSTTGRNERRRGGHLPEDHKRRETPVR